MRSGRQRLSQTVRIADSAPSTDLPAIHLSERVKSLRSEAGLTLAQLSERSGIARSTLSKIENNRLSPTYDTLVRLASGLGVNIQALFSHSVAKDPMGRMSITRGGEGKKYVTHAYGYEMLCSEISNKKLIPIHARVKAHSRHEFGELISHQGEEIVYVLKGTIELHTQFYEPVVLRTGDCVFFDSRMAHACIAQGPEEAEILWVASDNGAVDVVKRGEGRS